MQPVVPPQEPVLLLPAREPLVEPVLREPQEIVQIFSDPKIDARNILPAGTSRTRGGENPLNAQNAILAEFDDVDEPLFAGIAELGEPQSVKQALASPESQMWQDAMTEEYRSLQEN